MRPVAAVFSSFVLTIEGAINLKLFKDPKSVSFKGASSCATTASSCDIPPPDLDALAEEGYLQSEHGEDRCLVQQYFAGVCHGRYLDVGALDGVRFSNTHVLHQVFGWKGVNVEIDPENYAQLQYNRRKDLANVNTAVCSESRTVHYIHSAHDKAVGGIWELASEEHREKYWPGMTMYDAIPMMCTPLQSILDQTVGTRKFFFDLATIDLEGAELSALLGIDFNRISFGLIIVEKNVDEAINQQVDDLLGAKGYRESYVGQECGGFNNTWYIRSDFQNIYQRLNMSHYHTRGR